MLPQFLHSIATTGNEDTPFISLSCKISVAKFVRTSQSLCPQLSQVLPTPLRSNICFTAPDINFPISSRSLMLSSLAYSTSFAFLTHVSAFLLTSSSLSYANAHSTPLTHSSSLHVRKTYLLEVSANLSLSLRSPIGLSSASPSFAQAALPCELVSYRCLQSSQLCTLRTTEWTGLGRRSLSLRLYSSTWSSSYACASW